MKQVKNGTWLLLMMSFSLMMFSSCQKETGDKNPPANVSNYIKKDNKYYKLDAAMAMYDSLAPDKTIFSLNFHSFATDQDFVVFDYLLLQNTYELLPGSYSYQKLASGQNFQAGRFHDVVLKCNSPVMSGITYPVSLGTLRIARNGSLYTVEGELVMSGTRYEIRFAGPIDHIKAW